MAATDKGYVYSFVHAQMYRVNANGVPVGQLDPDALVADTTSHAYKLDGITNAEFGSPEFGSVTFRTGTRWQGTVDTGLINPGDITIGNISLDANLYKLLLDINIDTTTIVNTQASGMGYTRVLPNDIGVILTAQLFSTNLATLGQTYFVSVIVPRCTGRIIFMPFNQDGGENPSSGSIVLKPKISKKNVLGIAFDSTQNFENNEVVAYWLSADAPYALTTYIENGVATTYDVGYLPTSSTVTSGNTTNYFTQDGVVTAPTSISTSTGAVVITAGTSGDIANAFYQTNFAAIP